MNVLIIEDEKAAAVRLKNQISTLKPEIKILECLDSVENAIKWFNQNPTPDLIFLDIQLSDGLSFDIFEQVEINTPVIFTTAYDEYAIKAFELNSIDYLLKPIHIDKLSLSFQKLESTQELYSSGLTEHSFLNQLSSYLSGKELYRSRFLIPQPDGYVPVMAGDIAFIHMDNKCVIITTHKNKKYCFRYSLDKLEQELDPSLFWRANRTYIVSDKAIVKVHNYFNYKLKLEINPSPETDVVISRKKVSEFKNWYAI